MCGITARVGHGDALDQLLTGLENLEYRGYDSAGLAIKNGSALNICKQEGEILHLKEELKRNAVDGDLGIGHTRWSTHGPPTDENAHPHVDCTGRVAVVHNGIIENYESLRDRLLSNGHEFTSETDTEVIPHLVEERLAEGHTPEEAFRRTVRNLDGSYAVAMIVEGTDAIFATRRGSPLILGVDDGTRFLASDVPAFLDFTDTVIYLEDGDVVVVEPDAHSITDLHGNPVYRDVSTVDWVAEDAEKGGYDHYMLKEIHEQPTTVTQTIQGRFDTETGAIGFDEISAGAFADVTNVQLVACGTSYHAAMYGSQLLNARGIPAQALLANEYAFSPPPVDEGTLVVGVTQSGETADTLVSLRRAMERGTRTLALTNVVGSTAARECDDALAIRAGPEIGVAATKTFSSQVAALALFAERVVRDVSGEPGADADAMLASLASLPKALERVVEGTTALDIAQKYERSDAYFFIGRGLCYPVALEGALKFKEITYEHAEGFAAGELKHGPLALITPDTPVIAAFSGRHDGKTLNNVREVQARGAPVVAVADESNRKIEEVADDVLPIPSLHPDVAGLAANVQLQLVSYHVANLLNRPIDKPRNLAKSVTVE